MSDGPAVELRPILPIDLPLVGQFLHLHLNSRVPASTWASAAAVPWTVTAPNHGFMLVVDEAVVGVHLAFYSKRVVAGRQLSICNLGAWAVHPSYRQHGFRLLRALLKQQGYEFTDLSPSGNVVALNQRLKFRLLDTATAVVPTFAHALRHVPGRIKVLHRPADIDRHLHSDDRQLYDDHRRAAAVRHLLVIRNGQSCYVMYRRDRRKNLPMFASFLHVSNPDLFEAAMPRISRHLLLFRGIPFLLCELRVIGHRPQPSVSILRPRPKMFRSGALTGDDVDYLYSELVCVGW